MTIHFAHNLRVRSMMKLLLIMVALLSAPRAWAAEVNVSVSQRESVVGVPVQLVIEIVNAKDFQAPELPEIAGAAVQPNPTRSESTSTFIDNGRVSTTRTVKLTYRIVPFQEGSITIPQFKVTADGQTFQSEPIEIVVNKPDGGNLLFAEVAADDTTVYLGQPVKLSLRIWIRPYHDQNFNLTLGAGDMWSMVDVGASTWGDFAEALAQLRDPFGGVRITAQQALRDDGEGTRRSYYLFDLPITIWPQSAGSLQIEEPRIIMGYPVRLARQDSFFPTGRLAVAEQRALSVVASAPEVMVMEPPAQGRPAMFNGAVGRFDFNVSAQPLEVAVGDPITLTLRITDRSQGRARLDLVPPPPLDRVDELAANFRMPSDPLAGTVTGDTKTFTQTLRARSADVNRIPPITFAYFDPESETYQTVQSQPITLRVTGSAQVGLNEIMQAQPLPANSPNFTLKATSGGILANHTDIDALLATQRSELNRRDLIFAVIPPAVVGLVMLMRLMLTSRAGSEITRRRRTAGKRALQRLRALPADPSAHAAGIINTISEYLADRMNRPAGTLTAAEVSRMFSGNANDNASSSARVSDTVRTQLVALLEDCEQRAYGGGVLQTQDLKKRSIDCIKQLERCRL